MRKPILYLLLGSIPVFLGIGAFLTFALSSGVFGLGPVAAALVASGFALAATMFILGIGFIAVGIEDVRGRTALWV